MIRKYISILAVAILFIVIISPYSAQAAKKENFHIEQGEQFSLFPPMNLAPSRSTEKKTITISNNNDSKLEFNTSFEFHLNKEGLDAQSLDEMLRFYEMSAEIYYLNEIHTVEWTSLPEIDGRMQSLGLYQLPPNESLEIIYSIRLLETADNDFQAASLIGKVVISSLTDVNLVETEIKDQDENKNALPKTATEIWTYFYIGTLLSIGGTALLIYYSIVWVQRKRGKVYGE